MFIENRFEVLIKHRKLTGSGGAILFIPGYFSASSLGPNRLFVEIEQLLIDKCSNSYRLDWPGMGDNTGSLDDYSFSEIIKKLSCLIESFSGERISIISHSLGCHFTYHALKKTNASIHNIINLSPITINNIVYSNLIGSIETENNKIIRKGVNIHLDFSSYNNIKKHTGTITPDKLTKVKSQLWVVCLDDPFFHTPQNLIKYGSRNIKTVTPSNGGHNYISQASKNTIFRNIVKMDW